MLFGRQSKKTCVLSGELSKCREENARAASSLLDEIRTLLNDPKPSPIITLPVPRARAARGG